MLSDIVTLILAVTGVVFILFSIIFRLLVWKEKDVSIAIPLNTDDDEIYNRITNIREICSFIRIEKQCTIVVVNYGASEEFLNNLKKYFSQYDFLRVIQAEQPIKELHT